MPDEVQTQRARALRATQSDAERLLWGSLRSRRLGGWKWRRQAPVGPFTADFLCIEAKLVVELDGSQHNEPEALAYDSRRTEYLELQGLRVIRFRNGYVFESLSGVSQQICAACDGDNPNRQAEDS